MIQKPALWISTGLTVFILITLSIVFSAAAKGSSLATDPSSGTVASTQLSPELAQLISDRESAYAQLINQANQQLTQAQAALQAGQATSSDAQNSAGMPISAEQASALALTVAAAGAQPSGEAQLVNFEGKVAYEVPFDYGNIYIDATSGEVLNNGTINLQPSLISPEQAAQIAVNYMGRTDVYNIEIYQLNGINVYRVKFSNSDAVFVDPYGQILLVRLAPSGTASQSGEQHESEHEDDDD